MKRNYSDISGDIIICCIVTGQTYLTLKYILQKYFFFLFIYHSHCSKVPKIDFKFIIDPELFLFINVKFNRTINSNSFCFKQIYCSSQFEYTYVNSFLWVFGYLF